MPAPAPQPPGVTPAPAPVDAAPPADRPGVFTRRFPATRRGARLARLLTGHHLGRWGHPRGGEPHDTVVLVVAELVTNAALHGCVPGRDFLLRLDHDTARGIPRVEVSDTHPAQPAQGTPGADDSGGRGLLLVDALTVAWGVRSRRGPGKTVWAECATVPPSERARGHEADQSAADRPGAGSGQGRNGG